MQLNMQASPIGMASASQADFGGFDSRRLLHVSWIKMLSTAKTSENTSFSEVFCCFSGINFYAPSKQVSILCCLLTVFYAKQDLNPAIFLATNFFA